MEDKSSEHISNIFTITSTNGSTYLDNDMVKQTILAQEATFREQVLELHRLYNVQKNQMELECQRGELSEHCQDSGGIRIVQQVDPPTRHDLKKPSEKFMKGKDLVCSSNGVSMRPSNSRSTQDKLTFQVPDDAHVYNSDDDVVILSEKPSNSLVRNKGSTPGTNVKYFQVPANAHDHGNDDDVVVLLEKPAKSCPITNGSIIGTNVKDFQVLDDAHADDSDDDVVILSEKPGKSLPRNIGSVLGTHVKNLQVPNGAHVYDCDDDVVILLEKSVDNLPRNDGSILGTNVKPNGEGSSRWNKKWITGLQPSNISTKNVLNKKVIGPSSNRETTNFPSMGSSSSWNQVYSSPGVSLNLRNVKLKIESSSHMNKNRVSGLQQSHVSTLNDFNKKGVTSSSTIKTKDFPRVGASSSQNQCYSSLGVDLNLPNLENTLQGKHVGAAIDLNVLVENEETQRNNSYIHKKYDRTNVMECFTHDKNSVDSSTAHDQSSCCIRNPKTFAASSSSATLKSLWQSNTKDYKNGRLPTLQEYCHLTTPNTTELGGGRFQKQSQFYNYPKDMNLSNGPRDATATLGQAREDTPMEISWVRRKLLNMRKGISMKKSQVPSNYATRHPQILPDSMSYSEGSTKILGFPINAPTKKDSQLLYTMHKGTNETPSSMGVANMEMQFHNKDGSNAGNLIDLNVALPFMDEMEIDAHMSEGNTVPREPDDSSNEDIVVTAAKTLMAMHKVEFREELPKGNNNNDDYEALKLRLFKTKHRMCSSTLLTQENMRSKDHGVASASSSIVPDKSISSAETPPEGRYARYPGF